ncbi:MAG: GNAT family N-acetyltransferase [Chloroflexota bacterium]
MTELNSEYQILTAGLKDLNSLRGLEKLCFPIDAWPFLDMIGALTLPNIVRFKMEDDGQLIGFIAGDVRKMQRVGWIATVAVHPDYRRRGLAEKLLELCEDAMGMPRIKLTVRASNEAAIMLYRRNGYLQVGRWRNYYKGGEDGVVMEKTLL